MRQRWNHTGQGQQKLKQEGWKECQGSVEQEDKVWENNWRVWTKHCYSSVPFTSRGGGVQWQEDRNGLREPSCHRMSESNLISDFTPQLECLILQTPEPSRSQGRDESCSAAPRWSRGPKITADWSKTRCEINSAPVHHICKKKSWIIVYFTR